VIMIKGTNADILTYDYKLIHWVQFSQRSREKTVKPLFLEEPTSYK